MAQYNRHFGGERCHTGRCFCYRLAVRMPKRAKRCACTPSCAVHGRRVSLTGEKSDSIELGNKDISHTLAGMN